MAGILSEKRDGDADSSVFLKNVSRKKALPVLAGSAFYSCVINTKSLWKILPEKSIYMKNL
jgi:hypothetical protein